MENLKITPGEWYVDEDHDVITNEPMTANIVCLRPKHFRESMKYWKANANLIAAAPDLYEAVGQLLSRFKAQDELDQKALHIARVALLKAQGGEHE